MEGSILRSTGLNNAKSSSANRRLQSLFCSKEPVLKLSSPSGTESSNPLPAPGVRSELDFLGRRAPRRGWDPANSRRRHHQFNNNIATYSKRERSSAKTSGKKDWNRARKGWS